MRFINWVILGPLLLVALSFAGTNRYSVEVGFWPLPFLIELPIALLVLFILLFGVILGSALTWDKARPIRKNLRESKKEVKQLQAEIEQLKSSNKIEQLPEDTEEIIKPEKQIKIPQK